MTALHWKVREYAKELRPDGRLTLLTMLILHANVRMRSWPSVDLLAEESGWSVPSIVLAKSWLVAHKAIELVDFKMRVGEERKLPKRQTVYQLTGTIEINGQTLPYLYTPDPETKVGETSHAETKLSETKPTEVSPTLAKGIPDSKGIPESSAPPRGVENLSAVEQTIIPPAPEKSGDSEKKEAAPEKKPRPRNPLFDAVGEYYLELPPGSAAIDGLGGLIGSIVAILKKQDPALSSERIKASAAHFKKANPGCHLPNGKYTIPKSYGAWLQTQRISEPKPGQQRLNTSSASDSYYERWNGSAWVRVP